MFEMTYFGFLLRFLAIPILLLAGVAWLDGRRGRERPPALRGWPAWAAIGLHVLVAVAYTTPWDNYLVATGVWWYEPELVVGLTLGWVPIEEYTFFVLQTVLGGLWLLFLARRLPPSTVAPRSWSRLRLAGPALLAPVWIASIAVLAAGWGPGAYLALELVWALPPIGLQLAFGADILWRHRRLVALGLVPLALYLSISDALAIDGGTWTISPAHSLGVLLGGVLPLEEFIFFVLTNTLVVLGITLLWAGESRERARLVLRVAARREA